MRGTRVGIVDASIDEELLASLGAIPVEVKDDSRLLRLLDEGRADYVLLTMTTLPAALGEALRIAIGWSTPGKTCSFPAPWGYPLPTPCCSRS